MSAAGTAMARRSRANSNTTIPIPTIVTNRMPFLPKYSFMMSVTMNVMGKASTPAVITTSSKVMPSRCSVKGNRKAVKNLEAVASASTSAVMKIAVQTTKTFCGRLRT